MLDKKVFGEVKAFCEQEQSSTERDKDFFKLLLYATILKEFKKKKIYI